MEVSIGFYKIRNYVISALHKYEWDMDELFISKFDPFHKWEIGSLRENEILEAVLAINTESTGIKRPKLNVVNSKGFSLLIQCIQQVTGDKLPNEISLEEWLKVRTSYEAACKKEHELTFGNLSFDDKLGKSLPKSTFELKDFELIYANIESILNATSHGGWTFELRASVNEAFTYHVAVLNFSISEENIFEQSIAGLIHWFPKSDFQLKKIETQFYIEGFILID